MVEPTDFLFGWREFRILVAEVYLVMTRSADNDYIFGKVADVMSDYIIMFDSFFTCSTEPIRTLLTFTLFRTIES